MKTSYGFIWLIIAMILVGLPGCGSSKKEQSVLVVLGSQSDLAYESLETAAKQWAEERNISLQAAAPKLSTVYEQQKILENSIREKKWDLIIIEPLGDDALYPVLEYAKNQGSIVVAMQGAKDLQADYTIQPWNYEELGRSVMDVLASQMEQSGTYVTVVPSKEQDVIRQEESACVDWQKGSYQKMLAASRLQEGGSIQKAYDTTDTLFQAYEMKGIVFFSDMDGLGISRWKENTGNHLTAVGIGTSEVLGAHVEDGSIDALFYWNRVKLLMSSLEVGYKAAEGSISDKPDTITTKVDGYRTLRSLGDGIYYGNDISAAYSEDSR